MTGWIKPCGDAACIEISDNGFGGKAIRTTTKPDHWLEVSGEEWDAFVAGLRSELVAENARLRQQVAEAAEWHAHSVTLNSVSYRVAEALAQVKGAESYVGNPVRQVEQLIAERDEARLQRDASNAIRQNLGAEVDRLKALADTARNNADELRRQRDEWRKERDEVGKALDREHEFEKRHVATIALMRPVVEAASVLLRLKDGPRDAAYEAQKPMQWAKLRAGLAAVDAYRAAQPDQKAPETAPRSPQADERGADGQRDGPEAQGGAQGDDCPNCGSPIRDFRFDMYSRSADDDVECENTWHDAQPAPADAGPGWSREGKVVHFDIPTPDLTDAIPVGTFEFEATAPADPAGLDAAIEAAARADHSSNRLCLGPFEVCQFVDDHRQSARAAAPHIRRAALQEAADEFERDWAEAYGGVVAGKLRERAEREATT